MKISSQAESTGATRLGGWIRSAAQPARAPVDPPDAETPRTSPDATARAGARGRARRSARDVSIRVGDRRAARGARRPRRGAPGDWREGSGVRPLRVGVMIEVPSAAFTADLLAAECDFLTIGTNDLIQCCLAVDRTDERVSHLYEPLHPAILRLIRHIRRAAATEGAGVGVRGDGIGSCGAGVAGRDGTQAVQHDAGGDSRSATGHSGHGCPRAARHRRPRIDTRDRAGDRADTSPTRSHIGGRLSVTKVEKPWGTSCTGRSPNGMWEKCCT